MTRHKHSPSYPLWIAPFLLIIGVAVFAMPAFPVDNTLRVFLDGPTTLQRGDIAHARTELTTDRGLLSFNLSSGVGPVVENSRQVENGVEIREFTMTVRDTTLLGPAALIANAILDDGTRLVSQPIELWVEYSEEFTSIRVEGPIMPLSFIGDSIQINVFGVNAAGKKTSIVGSHRLAGTSSDSTIARLELSPLAVFAAGVGSTNLTFVYRDERRQQEVQGSCTVRVRSSQLGDLNGNGMVEESDFNTIYSAIKHAHCNFTVKIPGDGRDIDHNGVIDNGDLRALILLCDFPNCNYRALHEGEPTPTPLALPSCATSTPTPNPTACVVGPSGANNCPPPPTVSATPTPIATATPIPTICINGPSGAISCHPVVTATPTKTPTPFTPKPVGGGKLPRQLPTD